MPRPQRSTHEYQPADPILDSNFRGHDGGRCSVASDSASLCRGDVACLSGSTPSPIGSSGALFTGVRERLSERLLKLIKDLRLGLEKLVIIALRHDQCRFIRLLN